MGAIAAGVPIVGGERRTIAVLTIAGVAADADLLFHVHRGPSHSLGIALAAGLLALVVTRAPRWGIATTIAWTSHVALDWLGQDTWPPFGVPVLWPFTSRFFISRVVIFPSVSRQYWRGDFLLYNLEALLVELLVLLPLTLLALQWRRRPQ